MDEDRAEGDLLRPIRLSDAQPPRQAHFAGVLKSVWHFSTVDLTHAAPAEAGIQAIGTHRLRRRTSVIHTPPSGLTRPRMRLPPWSNHDYTVDAVAMPRIVLLFLGHFGSTGPRQRARIRLG